MAKVPFTKLALKRNEETKIVEWNGQKIEVKQYLPMENKLNLIATIIGFSADDHVFYNPCKVQIFERMWTILEYTNINLTDKQADDVLKLYDLFVSSGLAQEIESAIPETERDYIHLGTMETIGEIYRYRNSAQGVMESVVKDFENTKLDVNELADSLTKTGELETVKKVITELG